MKQERKRKAAQPVEKQQEESPYPGGGSTADSTPRASDLTEDLLEEIDSLLESDLVAKEYVQKGGQ